MKTSKWCKEIDQTEIYHSNRQIKIGFKMVFITLIGTKYFSTCTYKCTISKCTIIYIYIIYLMKILLY